MFDARPGSTLTFEFGSEFVKRRGMLMLSDAHAVRSLLFARPRAAKLPRAGAARLLFAALLAISSAATARTQVKDSSTKEPTSLEESGVAGNLVEQVPSQYREKYEKWKTTFLSAGAGRQLWSKYAGDPGFRLTIVVSKSSGQGAMIRLGDYRWNGGRLVAATIVLGNQLDNGYPVRDNYPVLGSLRFIGGGRDDTRGEVLAAAKIAHELGHVELAASSDAASYRLQNDLALAYASHFSSNGHRFDPVMTNLERMLGGTPDEIDAEREYMAETCTLRYLLETLTHDKRRKLLKLLCESEAGSEILALVSPAPPPA